MRITIHVDNHDTPGPPAPAPGQGITISDIAPTGSVSTNAGAAQGGPPAELAARAARLGALSAGPAPSGPPEVAGAPGFAPTGLDAQPSGRADTVLGSSTDASAGPAPTGG
ncbi:hypothetical protein [Frankia sp. CiP1_Cm_nod1]|uniref:hypothetical protein n=1 Tax=Frankia sp. CiP1_Cm_nod1 TaxID=2897160 RepID=UPI002024BDEA